MEQICHECIVKITEENRSEDFFLCTACKQKQDDEIAVRLFFGGGDLSALKSGWASTPEAEQEAFLSSIQREAANDWSTTLTTDAIRSVLDDMVGTDG